MSGVPEGMRVGEEAMNLGPDCGCSLRCVPADSCPSCGPRRLRTAEARVAELELSLASQTEETRRVRADLDVAIREQRNEQMSAHNVKREETLEGPEDVFGAASQKE